MPPTADRERLRRQMLRRQPNFRLLWTARTVSLAGDGIVWVALSWQALTLGGGGALAVVFAARSIPRVLLLPVGGAIADRADRRRLLIGCDLAQTAILTLVAVLAAAGQLHLLPLAAAAAATGVVGAVFLPTVQAFTADIVPQPLLPRANAALQASRSTTELLLGPAAGGLLIATVGLTWAWTLDAASFAISAAAIAAIRHPDGPTLAAVRRIAPAVDGNVLAGVREGLRYIRRRRWLTVAVLATGATGIVGAALIGVLLPLQIRRLDAGPAALGVAFAGFGVGGILAAVAAAVRPPRRMLLAAYCGFAAACAAAGGVAWAPTIAAVVVGMLLVGCCESWADQAWTTALQQLIPDRMLGRVFAASQTVFSAAVPIAYLTVGPLADHLGPTRLLTTLGATGVILMAAAATDWVVSQNHPVDDTGHHGGTR